MNAYYFGAVVLLDSVRCVGCLPVTADHLDVHPIFANSEWDYYPTCDLCGLQHEYVNLIGRQVRP